MTAQLPPCEANPGFAPGAAGLSRPPDHRAPAANATSIIALHVHDDGCACATCVTARRQQLALERLAVYLDVEGPALDRLLYLLDLGGARADLAALGALHVGTATGEADAIADAARHLERILDDLENIPVRAPSVALIRPNQPALGRELDAAVRWLGARTADTLAVLRQALR